MRAGAVPGYILPAFTAAEVFRFTAGGVVVFQVLGGGAASTDPAITLDAIPGARTEAALPISGAYYNGTPASIEYRLDGGAWTAAGATIGGGTFAFTLAPQAAGAHTLAVRWSDKAAATASADFLVALRPPQTGLLARIAFEDLSKIFQDTAGTVPVSEEGNPIGRVNDADGRAGVYASPSLDTFRPTLLVDALNSRNAVQTVATSATAGSHLRVQGVSIPGPKPAFTAYVVAAYTDPTVSNRILLSLGNAATGSGVNRFMLRKGTSANLNAELSVRGSSANVTAALTPWNPNEWRALTVETASVDQKGTIILDRGAGATSSAVAQDFTANPINAITIGADFNSASTTAPQSPGSFRIAEVLIYAGEHDAGQRAAVWNYLLATYGLPA